MPEMTKEELRVRSEELALMYASEGDMESATTFMKISNDNN